MTIPIVAVAMFMTACGSAATLSSSSGKDRAAPAGAVQLNGGTNAGSTSDITNRPNPVHKAGSNVVKPLTPSSNAAPASALPSFGSAVDRCGMAIDTGVAGNRGTPRFGTHLPKLMCAVE